MTISYGHAALTIQVRYSPRRKTVQIAVGTSGEVTLTAPSRCSDRELAALVQKKAGWIEQKRAQMISARERRAARDLSGGGPILYQGREFALAVQIDAKAKKASVALDGDLCRIISRSGDLETIRAALSKWYAQQAAEKVGERLRWFAPFVGASPKQVQIRNPKRRWGSCSSDGRLSVNWRCILAPEPVLDYIVVHELCHLHVMNHSPQFWERVKTVLPEYKEQRKWLRKNGMSLDF